MKSPKIEILSSCWNYPRPLVYHLSSFILYPPRTVQLTVSIAYCQEDAATAAVLAWFAGHRNHHSYPRNITWRWLPFERRRLMRRAISRNEAARATTADYLMFSDVDYLYRDDAIDQIAAALSRENATRPKLLGVSCAMQSNSHDAGDAEIARVDLDRLELLDVTPSRYHPIPIPRPIGGCQWISGEMARARGYLPDTRWQEPADQWKRTYEDATYRVFCERHGIIPQTVSVPGVWRIRHSKRGREHVGCVL